MDTAAIISQAAAYTQKFIDAAIPVAKKAYEIGLLTIQIDALSAIVPIVAGSISILFAIKWLNNRLKSSWFNELPKKAEYAFDQLNARGFVFAGVVSCIVVEGILLIQLINVWLWVKLFCPELWLAKQAIEKVLEVAK